MKKQALFLLCFFVLLRGFAQIPTNGLAACYLFNGNANDASGNGNHGTVRSATLTTDRCNNPNSAYSFNGNSYIQIPYSPSLNCHTNEVTVSFWVYTTANDMSLICKSGWKTYDIDYRIQLLNNPFGGFSVICNQQEVVFTYANAPNLNKWVHFAFVYNNGMFKFYINSSLIVQQPASPSLSYPVVFSYNTDLYIGADPCVGVEYTQGKIDDVCIYNRALTDNEILLLYNLPCSTVVSTITPALDTVTICKGQSITLPNGKTYSKDTVVRGVVPGSKLCDSLVAWQVIVTNCDSNIVKPSAADYIACKGANVNLEVEPQSGVVFYWYSAQAGGSPLKSASNTYTVTNVSPPQTFWVEPRVGSIIYPRVAITISLSESCGGTQVACAKNGTILFKEDFGGNNPSDPAVKPTGIPQINPAYNYLASSFPSGTHSCYSINKYSLPHATGTWYRMDDHTYPSDTTRGYLLQVNATENKGLLYENQINNLCSDSKLYFSAWVVSLITHSGGSHKTNLVFALKDNAGATIAQYYTGNLPDMDPTWKQYGFEFTTPSGTTSLKLQILNNGEGSASGNDFAMDDIEIRLCSLPTITIYDTTCPNTAYTKNNFNIPADSLQTIGTFEFSDTIPSATGCDTIIVLNLNVKDKDTTKINAAICEGNSYTQNGFSCSESGTYIDTLQNRFGCDSIVILNLSVVKPPDTVTISASICEGETYTKNGFSASKTGTYTQILQNYAGCDSVTVLDLIVNPTPDIEIVAVTDNFCEKDFIELEIITNGDNILWSTGSSENPITITKSGTYTAMAYLGDCKKTASYFVDECPCYVWLPNAFTPNNDGLNETFKPYISCFETMKDYRFFIYDRWGNIVFKSFDYATGWDGTDGKGKVYASGAYSCVVDFTTSKNKHITKKGAVTVIK